ncbi:MAG: peptidoglycan DD-metalloendopeptidase family protein [Ignavibacteria bacterium]|nr:peptidoglycan DD-metalloendopeptidase family protein [Ignavibacteria bacterium]
MKKNFLLFLILIPALVFSQTASQDEKLFFYNSPKQQQNCTPEIKFNPEIHENVSIMLEGGSAELDWPLSYNLNSGAVIVNYVDNQSGGTIKDYEGNDWAYNGHNGTDIALHDFRNMDRCVPVVAGESGRVVEIAYTSYDRNTTWDGQPANIVCIRHDDGTYAYYYHLMKNSVLPRVGEYVVRGRTIGFVGSSGNSSDAHLHIEPGMFVNNNWVKRDPWNGSFNTLPSLWRNQLPYVGDTTFNLHDMGVYVASSVGGDVEFNTDYAKLKERIISPNTVSGYEPKIGFWMQFQGNATGRQAKYEIRRSDGTLFDDITFSMINQYQYAWSWWTPDFNPGIGVTGDWYVRVLYDNVEKGRCFFDVQLLTSNRPRLYPVAGKCFRKGDFTRRDTLRVRPVRTNMQYDLLGAPSNVTITNDSIINISPSYTQTYRLREFKVVASMGGSSTLRDTMIYKLVDTTKPNPIGNGIVSLDLTAFTEGRFDGSDFKGDTVTVQLRGSLSPYGIVDQDKFKLNNDGYGIANFPNASPGVYYYLVVKHRNSIETWSKTVQQFPDGYPHEYNFTTSRTKAYGDNLKFKNFKYCLYSGDVNQDGIVDATDFSMVDNDVSFFIAGYEITDLDGDFFVDAGDMAIVDNNAYNFVSKVRP